MARRDRDCDVVIGGAADAARDLVALGEAIEATNDDIISTALLARESG
jgi:hypothetical protein